MQNVMPPTAPALLRYVSRREGMTSGDGGGGGASGWPSSPHTPSQQHGKQPHKVLLIKGLPVYLSLAFFFLLGLAVLSSSPHKQAKHATQQLEEVDDAALAPMVRPSWCSYGTLSGYWADAPTHRRHWQVLEPACALADMLSALTEPQPVKGVNSSGLHNSDDNQQLDELQLPPLALPPRLSEATRELDVLASKAAAAGAIRGQQQAQTPHSVVAVPRASQAAGQEVALALEMEVAHRLQEEEAARLQDNNPWPRPVSQVASKAARSARIMFLSDSVDRFILTYLCDLIEGEVVMMKLDGTPYSKMPMPSPNQQTTSQPDTANVPAINETAAGTTTPATDSPDASSPLTVNNGSMQAGEIGIKTDVHSNSTVHADATSNPIVTNTDQPATQAQAAVSTTASTTSQPVVQAQATSTPSVTPAAPMVNMTQVAGGFSTATGMNDMGNSTAAVNDKAAAAAGAQAVEQKARLDAGAVTGISTAANTMPAKHVTAQEVMRPASATDTTTPVPVALANSTSTSATFTTTTTTSALDSQQPVTIQSAAASAGTAKVAGGAFGASAVASSARKRPKGQQGTAAGVQGRDAKVLEMQDQQQNSMREGKGQGSQGLGMTANVDSVKGTGVSKTQVTNSLDTAGTGQPVVTPADSAAAGASSAASVTRRLLMSHPATHSRKRHHRRHLQQQEEEAPVEMGQKHTDTATTATFTEEPEGGAGLVEEVVRVATLALGGGHAEETGEINTLVAPGGGRPVPARRYLPNMCMNARVPDMKLMATYIPGVHPTGPYHRQVRKGWQQQIADVEDVWTRAISPDHPPDIVVLGSCLWDLARVSAYEPEIVSGRELPRAWLDSWVANFTSVVQAIRATIPQTALLVYHTTMMPRFDPYTGIMEKAHLGRRFYVSQMNAVGKMAASLMGLEVLDYAALANRFAEGQTYLADSIHPGPGVGLEVANILLNYVHQVRQKQQEDPTWHHPSMWRDRSQAITRVRRRRRKHDIPSQAPGQQLQ